MLGSLESAAFFSYFYKIMNVCGSLQIESGHENCHKAGHGVGEGECSDGGILSIPCESKHICLKSSIVWRALPHSNSALLIIIDYWC